MKLRIRANSIRLRLTQNEVARLVDDVRVEESVTFGAGVQFRYALACANTNEKVRATFEAGAITVTLSRDVARAWATGPDVGIAGIQPAEGESLQLLIEKDFACLKP